MIVYCIAIQSLISSGTWACILTSRTFGFGPQSLRFGMHMLLLLCKNIITKNTTLNDNIYLCLKRKNSLDTNFKLIFQSPKARSTEVRKKNAYN